MLVFDTIILNVNRHFENLGWLINNHTNQIVSLAPIFDNGLSLLCYEMEDDLAGDSQYIKIQQIAFYRDFIDFVKPFITHR